MRQSSNMLENLRRLARSKELLQAWTWRIIRGRYQQSMLGGLWAIIQPAATVIILSIVFTRFMRVDTAGIPYVLFSYATMVPWTLFSASLSDIVNSIVENMNLVTKIYFPREVLPIAAMIARLIDFAIALGLLVALMIYFGVSPLTSGWFFVPVVLSIQIALTLGLGLIGAALNVFYRDIRHLFTLGLQVGLYASPVIYPVSAVPEQLRPFYYLNPMVGIIETYRDVLLYEKSPSAYLIWSALVALSIMLIGYWFFKRVEFQFADVI